MKYSMQGLAALYGWEVMQAITDYQLNDLFRNIFNSNGVAHAMAFLNPVASSIDFMGIFRRSNIRAEEGTARRIARESDTVSSPRPARRSSIDSM